MEPKPKKYVRIEIQTNSSSHHVCFKCRKQFRKPVDALVSLSHTGEVLETRVYDGNLKTYSCPQCAQPMTHLGKNFRPPPQDDIEGWEVARRLSDAGFKFGYTSQGSTKRLRDVSAFIERNRRKSEGEQLLDKWKAADK
ncbi:hypothetical protein [Deinococcus sp.]|uniref:hypothetical protein n=1 Tax=Deinococcus sp. TaxID=47478 RepID=UPI003B5B4382